VNGETQRLDKWMWFARCARTRSACQRLIEAGRVRVNGVRELDNDRRLKPGDVLTLTLSGSIRVLKVAGVGERRGGALQAALLFEDLSPQVPKVVEDLSAFQQAVRPKGAGRPSKRDRRQIARLASGPSKGVPDRGK
jgi:ribosome-associated heat shock protein Hsp15